MSGIRDAYIARTRTLIGQTVEAVRYVQLGTSDVADTPWDFEDWHHAEVGVDLATSLGKTCITWTDAFYPYGVDVFPATAMARLLVPESEVTTVDASSAPPWQERLGVQIMDLDICWDTLSIGPATSTTTGETVAPAYDVDVPTGIRLDTAAGPIWFIAASPQWPDMQSFFIPGDEIVVTFTDHRAMSMGLRTST